MAKEKNRRQRKARWISVKNQFRDPVCSDGTYWCNHVYEPAYPWVWVDFRFLSQRHHRRYFAVAARTLEYSVLDDIETEAWDEVDRRYPYEEVITVFQRGDFEILFNEPLQSQREQRLKLFKEIYPTLLTERARRPTIEVRRDYGDVAIGLWVTLNTPQITPETIHEFIRTFREMGEPISHGIAWAGDEVKIDAREVRLRYNSIYSAKPRKDS